MALELRQSLKLAQQLVMTPQLQQAIKLLQLSRLELQQAVREELEVNPALEEGADGPDGSPEEETPATPAEEEAAARVLQRLAELLAAEGERPGVACSGDNDARPPE